MTFLLEKISPQDRRKIMNDAKMNPDIFLLLEKRKYLDADNIDLTWAVDESDGSYLMSCPTPLHEPTLDTHYLFRLESGMIMLRVKGAFGRVAYICKSSASFALSDEIKSRLIDAFAKYGRFGKGSANDLLISDVVGAK